MTRRSLLLILSSGLGLALTALCVAGLPAGSALALSPHEARAQNTAARVLGEIHVCPSGCTYASIQSAVDDAEPGDVIKVAQGTYSDINTRDGITQVVYISKSLTIRGGYTTTNWTTPDPDGQPATLDAQGRGRVIFVSRDIDVTLEGLEVTGGDATGLGDYEWSAEGGGIYALGATITISGCDVVSNTAARTEGGYGAGLHLGYCVATLIDNTIRDNSAGAGRHGRGGGVHAFESQVTLENNTICSNTASSRGGGVCIYYGQSTLTSNTICSNTTTDTGSGAGIYLYYPDTTLTANTIVGNVSVWNAGGLFATGEDELRLDNNVVSNNEAVYFGSGLYFEAAIAKLRNNTLVGNGGPAGTGITAHRDYYGTKSIVEMTNTIVASHTLGVQVDTDCRADLDATLWYGNANNWVGDVTALNSRYGDPALARDGYHLTPGSAAIDQGVPVAVATDIDGEQRPQGGAPDIGADEFPLPPPDVIWKKQVSVNAGSFEPWDSGPFTVQPGDVVTLVDQVWITGTTGMTFSLTQGWRPGLTLSGWDWGTGGIVTATGWLTWDVADGTANQWHVLSTTVGVGDEGGLYEAISEVLTIEWGAPQPPGRVVELFNLGAETGCYARINNGTLTYPTVQSAVDVAEAGDLVKVGGYCTHFGHHGDQSRLIHLNKSLTLRGGYTTTNWITHHPAEHPTVLDAQARGRVLHISGDISPTIEGLRITGGDATGLGGSPWGDAGGGLYVDAPAATIRNNRVFNNQALHGAGFYLNQSAATLSANTIISNGEAGIGGGLYLYYSDGAVLARNVVSGNTAGFCAGVKMMHSDAKLLGNMFYKNKAAADSGGVDMSYSDATLIGNDIVGNSAGHSFGGLSMYGGTVSLIGNTIVSNTAESWAGGLHLNGCDSTLVNNAIVGNKTNGAASGLYVRNGSHRLLHTTIASNSGGDGSGVYVAALGENPVSVVMTNTIIADHTVGITVTEGHSATLNGTLWSGNAVDWSGIVIHSNDQAGDPRFAADGYHITPGSAAMDRGIDVGVGIDIDGETRPLEAGFDLGADEIELKFVYLPLVAQDR